MTKQGKDEANQGRRGVLKTLVMGAGGLTTLPILGQAQPARTAMAGMPGMDMAQDDVDAIAQDVDGKFMSAFVRAVKPVSGSSCCGPTCCS